MFHSRAEEVATVLAEHFPRDLADTVFAQRTATVVLDIADCGRWSVEIVDGVAKLSAGPQPRPTCSIHCDATTITDLLTGRRSGVEAFLAGDLIARGSLATVLQLGGAFAPDIEVAARPQAREIEVAGARTAYLEAGPSDAPPLVLLHGLGATNASMLPLLSGLAAQHRVLAPDIPGFGASEAPRWDYSAQQLCRWFHDFLSATDARGAAVVGNSLGGRLALESAMSDPQAASALVLLCPSPAFRRFRQLAPFVKLLPVDLARISRVALPRPLMTAALRTLFADPRRVRKGWYDAALDEFEIAMSKGNRRRAALSALVNIYTEEAFGEKGFWERLRNVRCPTLFVWGGDDHLVPSAFERHVTDAIPSANSVVIPDCGHLPQLEFPELTTRLVRRFIASSDYARRRSARAGTTTPSATATPRSAANTRF
ncbi:alpha/beta fold hydrolase [Rhodococcus sp. T9N]|jgi:pimeloyl-ACP methyl ester carboxylesterase|uniref:alpha/beta fold hydrolase n=1 Tax=Rhodococcus sp. T9N TaxID=627445 RepID=UPI0021C3F523|nr:alpha/beta hydrolase [Rhodococcus sp. T9N]